MTGMTPLEFRINGSERWVSGGGISVAADLWAYALERGSLDLIFNRK
jgi:hypothetical protein